MSDPSEPLGVQPAGSKPFPWKRVVLVAAVVFACLLLLLAAAPLGYYLVPTAPASVEGDWTDGLILTHNEDGRWTQTVPGEGSVESSGTYTLEPGNIMRAAVNGLTKEERASQFLVMRYRFAYGNRVLIFEPVDPEGGEGTVWARVGSPEARLQGFFDKAKEEFIYGD